MIHSWQSKTLLFQSPCWIAWKRWMNCRTGSRRIIPASSWSCAMPVGRTLLVNSNLGVRVTCHVRLPNRNRETRRRAARRPRFSHRCERGASSPVAGGNAAAMVHRRLVGMPEDLAGLCKLRIGDWRILYWVYPSQQIIRIYRIQHRSEVYRDL